MEMFGGSPIRRKIGVWRLTAIPRPSAASSDPANNDSANAPKLTVNKKAWPYNLFAEGTESRRK